jgi:hypothetical protein
LKAKFDKEKKRMLADFELRLKEELEKCRKEEEKKKEKALQSLQADCEVRYETLNRQFIDSEEKQKAKQASLLAEIDSLKQ